MRECARDHTPLHHTSHTHRRYRRRPLAPLPQSWPPHLPRWCPLSRCLRRCLRLPHPRRRPRSRPPREARGRAAGPFGEAPGEDQARQAARQDRGRAPVRDFDRGRGRARGGQAGPGAAPYATAALGCRACGIWGGGTVGNLLRFKLFNVLKCKPPTHVSSFPSYVLTPSLKLRFRDKT